MIRSTSAAALAVAMATMPVLPAAAQGLPAGPFEEIVVVPGDGSLIRWDGRPFAGELRITSAPDGLVVVEGIDVDGYLAGIREVPLSWPEEALAAQAVAARTYLAWTLHRGRSENGRRYGYDICATTACQVYRGAGVVLGTDGQRWLDAIERTSREILVYEGRPAQALYHSTSGGQTEPVQDIFPGSTPRPYLSGASSPEDSPLSEWSYEIPAEIFSEVLASGGVEVGSDLVDLDVIERAPGEGVWDAQIVSALGTITLPVNRVRAMFNVHGPERFPGLLPALRPDGRPYPQAVLSYRFEMTYRPPEVPLREEMRRLLPDSDLDAEGIVHFEGRGWGHHVGMSQFGAKALADAGSDYQAILSHYYGGLLPTASGHLLEDQVTVGLAWGLTEVSFEATGPFSLVGDGEEFVLDGGVRWTITSGDSGLVAYSLELISVRLLARLAGFISLR